MSYTVFSQGDDEYWAWLEQHPEGFVLNAYRDRENNTGLMQHHATCMYIADRTIVRDKKTYVGEDRIKVCAIEREALREHVRISKKLPATIAMCQVCMKKDEVDGEVTAS